MIPVMILVFASRYHTPNIRTTWGAGYVKNLWKLQIASDRFSKSEKGGIVQVLEYNNNNNTGTCILSAYFFNEIVYIWSLKRRKNQGFQNISSSLS